MNSNAREPSRQASREKLLKEFGRRQALTSKDVQACLERYEVSEVWPWGKTTLYFTLGDQIHPEALLEVFVASDGRLGVVLLER